MQGRRPSRRPARGPREQAAAVTAERFRRGGRHGSRSGAPAPDGLPPPDGERTPECARYILLEDDVEVRAAKAVRADATAPRQAVTGLPGRRLVDQPEGCRGEVDGGIRALCVKGRRQLAVMHRVDWPSAVPRRLPPP